MRKRAGDGLNGKCPDMEETREAASRVSKDLTWVSEIMSRITSSQLFPLHDFWDVLAAPYSTTANRRLGLRSFFQTAQWPVRIASATERLPPIRRPWMSG